MLVGMDAVLREETGLVRMRSRRFVNVDVVGSELLGHPPGDRVEAFERARHTEETVRLSGFCPLLRGDRGEFVNRRGGGYNYNLRAEFLLNRRDDVAILFLVIRGGHHRLLVT